MSAPACRAALETALASIAPPLPTAWTNVAFTPVPDVAYQRVDVLLAEPADMVMSGRVHREQGFMQVTLCYPLLTGAGAAEARAELIRGTFYAGRSFTSGGVVVRIEKAPQILPAIIEPDRYTVPVRVRFYANITRS